jgi:hypothetical protein
VTDAPRVHGCDHHCCNSDKVVISNRSYRYGSERASNAELCTAGDGDRATGEPQIANTPHVGDDSAVVETVTAVVLADADKAIVGMVLLKGGSDHRARHNCMVSTGNCPGAAAVCKSGCVTGVNTGFNTRDNCPACPMASRIRGIPCCGSNMSSEASNCCRVCSSAQTSATVAAVTTTLTKSGRMEDSDGDTLSLATLLVSPSHPGSAGAARVTAAAQARTAWMRAVG